MTIGTYESEVKIVGGTCTILTIYDAILYGTVSEGILFQNSMVIGSLGCFGSFDPLQTKFQVTLFIACCCMYMYVLYLDISAEEYIGVPKSLM